MPAFVGTQCRVYFALSDYHDIDLGQLSMQVIVNNQKTNITELNSEDYPQGVMACEIFVPEEGTEEFARNLYYIIIESEDLQSGFEHGWYYRVQMRFVLADIDTNKEYIENGIESHLDKYSEWSTVCLIKQIVQPELYINTQSPNSAITVGIQSFLVSGRVDFDDADDETLKSCQIIVQKEIEGTAYLIETSPTIMCNKYDTAGTFSYKIKTRLEDNSKYIVTVKYITRNLYKDEGYIILNTDFEIITGDLPTFTIEPDEYNSLIKLTITPATTDATNFVIVRASSVDGFATLDEVYLAQISGTEPIEWCDKTIESDVYYEYELQLASLNGDRYQETGLSDPVRISMDEVYLTTNDKQLKITLGNQISGFKYNIMENKTDTLGSKYPWIRRNGHSNYRSFSINGSIVYLGNNETVLFAEQEPHPSPQESTWTGFTEINKGGLFETRQTLIPSVIIDRQDLYEQYNLNHGIDDTNDYYLERRFREEVMKFLYSPDVKLYRSATEGNILVRLMNINLTPKNEIGKFIYDFSCEAVEVDEANIENYNIYNIQKLGNLIATGTEDYGYKFNTIIYRQGEIT